MSASFDMVCRITAAVRCLNSGQSVEQVAASAGRSESSVRRWLRAGGFRKINGKWRVS